jgi:sodium/proline symporter
MEASWSVLISFSAYTLAIVLVGLWSAKYATKTSKDYLIAGKGLGAWVSSISASASSESGWVTLGLVGEAFRVGLGAIWVIPGCLMGYIFNWYVMARRIQRYSSGSEAMTIPDILAERFSDRAGTIRLISVVVIAVMMTTYVAAQLNAAGKAFSAVFGTEYMTSVLIGAAIVLAYTISGGFRAVAWTDLVQGILMVIALVILPVIVIAKLGGFGQMFARLAQLDAESGTPLLMTAAGGKMGFLALGFIIGQLGIGLGYPGQPHVLIRYLAARDEESLRKGAPIAITWGTLVFTGAVFLGLACRALFLELPDAEQALPIISIQLLPGIFAGMMLAAVLAAICSTADSQLIVASSAISHDVYIRGKGKDLAPKHAVTIDRLWVAIIGLIAVIFALTDNRVIFSFVLYAWAGLGAAFGPIFILSFLWKKATSEGAIAGAVVGFLTVVIWRNVPALKGMVYELVPGFFLALAVNYVVSLVYWQKHKK